MKIQRSKKEMTSRSLTSKTDAPERKGKGTMEK